jgi:hypothetical protein
MRAAGSLDPEQCFLVQTLLMHDFRRALLHDPQLPVQLLAGQLERRRRAPALPRPLQPSPTRSRSGTCSRSAKPPAARCRRPRPISTSASAVWKARCPATPPDTEQIDGYQLIHAIQLSTTFLYLL